MYKYPSIDQFRNAIGTVQRLAYRNGARRDSDGEIIEGQQRTWKYPPVRFRGTVKLHGTNAAVVVEGGKVSYQSRNRVLTVDNDNAGFAAWATQHENLWRGVAAPFGDIILFGEWCGRGIQNGVALSELAPMFVVFEALTIDNRQIDVEDIDWLPEGAYRITDFPTWEVEIDFENPQLVQNQLVEITNAVEAECPVGKAFGVSGVGEGVVWSADVFGERVRFKVKGEKHSSYRVRTLAMITAENPETVTQFIDNALTDGRMHQGVEFLQEHGLPIALQSTGDFVRWIVADVVKEEADTMAAAGLDIEAVKKRLGSTAAIRYKMGLAQAA